MRTQTKLIAKVLDLSRVAGVAERLAEEQQRRPDVASLTHVRMALVHTRNGTFVVLVDGAYFHNPIDNGPTGVLMMPMTKQGQGLPGPFIGHYTAEELRSATTGEEMPLEAFINPGMLQDGRFIQFIAVNGLGALL